MWAEDAPTESDPAGGAPDPGAAECKPQAAECKPHDSECKPCTAECERRTAEARLRAAESSLLAELERIRERLDVVNDALMAVAAAPSDAQAAVLAKLGRTRENVEWDFEAKLMPLVNAEPALAERFAGPVERLRIEVDQADDEWPGEGGDTTARVAAAATARAHVAEALRRAHLILLPSRLQHALEAKPVAGSVPLGGLFPGDVDQAEAVALLAQRPAVFPGVVDSARGIVYRTANTTNEKLLYLCAPLVAFFGGVVFWWILGHLDEWTSVDIEQLKSTRHLLEVYVLVTFGALVHLVVSVRKRREASGPDAVIVAAELLDWAHVRAISICWLVVPIIVTTLVVRLTDLRVEGTEDWAVAILAGYSGDSIAQLGFDRLNQAVQVFAAKTGASKT